MKKTASYSEAPRFSAGPVSSLQGPSRNAVPPMELLAERMSLVGACSSCTRRQRPMVLSCLFPFTYLEAAMEILLYPEKILTVLG